MKMKTLTAIYRDADLKTVRIKIADGTTADFAQAIGFQIEDSTSEDTMLNGTYPVLNDEDFRHLEGKLLTLCDATFTNKEQREAFKRMVSSSLWGYFSDRIKETVKAYNN